MDTRRESSPPIWEKRDGARAPAAASGVASERGGDADRPHARWRGYLGRPSGFDARAGAYPVGGAHFGSARFQQLVETSEGPRPCAAGRTPPERVLTFISCPIAAMAAT